MKVDFLPMNERFAREMLMWRYSEPYDIYNVGSGDPESDVHFFTDPANRYFAAVDDRGELVAYRCFGEDARVPGGDYDDGPLDTGGGLRPDLTGRGFGLPVLRQGLVFGREMYRPPAFRATVAAFNQRALTVCRRAGFVEVSRFQRPADGRAFIVLARPASDLP